MFDPVNPYEHACLAASLPTGTTNDESLEAAQMRLAGILRADRYFRIALRITRNHADAEDCVSQAWMRLAPKVLGVPNLEAACALTVRRLALHVVRDRKAGMAIEELDHETTYTPVGIPEGLAWVLQDAKQWELACVAAYLEHGSAEACETYGGLKAGTVRKALSNIRASLQGKRSAMRESQARHTTKGTLVGHGWQSCKWLGVAVNMDPRFTGACLYERMVLESNWLVR